MSDYEKALAMLASRRCKTCLGLGDHDSGEIRGRALTCRACGGSGFDPSKVSSPETGSGSMKVVEDSIEFSTGKKKYCYAGIIGLSGDGEVTHGYDGGIYMPDPEVEKLEPNEILTKEELVELADFMIARWTAFRASHNIEPPAAPDR